MQNLKLNLIQTPENFQILDLLLENNGIIDPRELPEVTLPSDIDWKKGVVICGRGPIWLYSYLIHECHISAWVAVYDPRYGGIVVQAHKTDSPKIGEIIEQKKILKYYNTNNKKSKIIAFLGNPHTGKSVFLRLLRNHLKYSLSAEDFHRKVFVIKACPDGEGDWFSDISEDEGKIYRYKNKFDKEFVDRICQDIDNMKNEKSLILVDCGGKIDKYNQDIFNKCTHSIILGTDSDSIAEWRGASKLAELETICEVVSVKDEISEILLKSPLKIKYGFLDRNKRVFLDLPLELIENLK